MPGRKGWAIVDRYVWGIAVLVGVLANPMWIKVTCLAVVGLSILFGSSGLLRGLRRGRRNRTDDPDVADAPNGQASA